MASAVTETAPTVVPIVEDKITLTGLAREPIKSNGSLDSFESFDVTPIIGREFPNANLKDFLRAPNSDDRAAHPPSSKLGSGTQRQG